MSDLNNHWGIISKVAQMGVGDAVPAELQHPHLVLQAFAQAIIDLRNYKADGPPYV